MIAYLNRLYGLKNSLTLAFALLGLCLSAIGQLPNENRWYVLTNTFTGPDKVLTAEETDVRLRARDNSPAQQWRFVPIAGDYYKIFNRAAGEDLAFDVRGDGEGSDEIFLGGTQNVTGQQWELTPFDGARYFFSTGWQGVDRVMDVINDANDDKVHMVDYIPASGQLWTLTEAEPRDVFAGATELSDGWVNSWMGWMYVLEAPWYYNVAGRDWYYVYADASDTNFWYYDATLNDLRWTNAATWPNAYSRRLERWVNGTTPERTIGYVWANRPTEASYRPDITYAYNSAGGDVRIDRVGVGQYEVIFTGLGGQGAEPTNVQASLYGSTPGAITIFSWIVSGSDLKVNIDTADAAGVLADRRFTVLVTWPQADKKTAFAWSDDRSEAATFPLAANFSHNPSGGTISGGYSESGEYSIQFTDLNAEAGNGRAGQYQVTAYGVEGISIRAKLSGILFGGGVTPLIRGMNLAGESVPSSFTLLATWPDGDANAYVWAGQAEEASYTPNPDFAYNPSGGGITVTRSSVGVYTVIFEDYTLDGGNVQVTPWSWVDTTATVNVVSWYNFQGNLEVDIRAYDAAGNPSDAVFSLLVTNRP